ncbi:histone deacetylase superfamily [Desulfosarcina variabilis str. Montpellier]|uniref:histone deacetylase family protein n=1 Tax=Desulfosarcina variabilis TaxID=2300 RepID=UPI003AFA7F93
MNVYFHPDFFTVYTNDPAAEAGRMEVIMDRLAPHVDIVTPDPIADVDLMAVHPKKYIESIRRRGLYDIAALAAGAATQAAAAAMQSPSFALVRPPGHHASADSCWGFCFFNNMAISLMHLYTTHRIKSAFILDFDMHYGDGTVNILGHLPWVEILNPEARDRRAYLSQVDQALLLTTADVIAVSAGFDNHIQDWGGLLLTDDYRTMGGWVLKAAARNHGGCYGIFEGGYNHNVLGSNVLAFLQGLMGQE